MGQQPSHDSGKISTPSPSKSSSSKKLTLGRSKDKSKHNKPADDPGSGGTSPSPSPTPNKKEQSKSTLKPDAKEPKRTASTDKKADAWSEKKCTAWFDKLTAGGDTMGPEEVDCFCSELGIEASNIFWLVFAYHVEAKQMGFFHRTEFVRLEKIGVDSTEKLAAKRKAFEDELANPQKFKEIYKFAFYWAKNPEQKIIDIETAVAMLTLLTEGRNYPHASAFLEFLQEQDSYRSVNADQWMSFLDFATTVSPDFKNYDENMAWPVMLDEYVDWSKEKGTPG